jgi:hypothetical protein
MTVLENRPAAPDVGSDVRLPGPAAVPAKPTS